MRGHTHTRFVTGISLRNMTIKELPSSSGNFQMGGFTFIMRTEPMSHRHVEIVFDTSSCPPTNRSAAPSPLLTASGMPTPW